MKVCTCKKGIRLPFFVQGDIRYVLLDIYYLNKYLKINVCKNVNLH